MTAFLFLAGVVAVIAAAFMDGDSVPAVFTGIIGLAVANGAVGAWVRDRYPEAHALVGVALILAVSAIAIGGYLAVNAQVG